jgi:2-succinyl-5-enolpyruvyl-6-hydroxy-3-cyclohexene-1-carboxylate synthase
MDFRHAAAQFGLAYHQPATQTELTTLLSRSRHENCLIECRTDRGSNHALHLEIARKVRELEMRWDA